MKLVLNLALVSGLQLTARMGAWNEIVLYYESYFRLTEQFDIGFVHSLVHTDQILIFQNAQNRDVVFLHTIFFICTVVQGLIYNCADTRTT